MKYKFLILLLLIFFINTNVVAISSTKNSNQDLIDEFLETAKEYSNEIFPELENGQVLERIIKGDAFESETIIERILGLFTKEIKSVISIAVKIIAVSTICSLLKNIQVHNNNNVGEVAFYICYLFVVTLVITSYSDISTLCVETMNKLNGFMNIIIPLFLSLMVVNGNIASVSLMQPVLILMINLVNTLIVNIVIPIIFISMVINIISSISNSIEVSKLPSILQKTSVWTVNFILGILIGILSLEGSLTANVDGFAAKTAKTVVSTVIPVVGKALSDATDSIIGAASITKNALGIVGIIAIVGIVCIPIIKSLIMMIIFNISSALIEPLVDKRMSKCVSDTADSIKIIFGLMTTVSILFIIAITLMIKVGNFTLMYK